MSDVIELKIMIHKVLLPRIRQLEEELKSLRKHTWPYVQGKKESHQLDDIEMKVDFLKHLDDDTIIELLRTKARLSGNTGFLTREYDSLRNNFCWALVNMLGDLFKTSGEPMGNTQLGFTIACLLCSVMGLMGIMRIPMKTPPILAACALSACCSSSQTSSLVNDVQKRVKKSQETPAE